MNPLLVSPLLTPLIELAGKVFDRVLPNKEAADQAKAQFALQAAQMSQSEVKEFHDFVVAYEGAGAEVTPALQILRGSVRPVLTYVLVALFGYGFVHPGEFTPEQMLGLFQLNLISLTFWYGERALSNLGLDLSKRGTGSDK
jgi:hypothetical protein